MPYGNTGGSRNAAADAATEAYREWKEAHERLAATQAGETPTPAPEPEPEPELELTEEELREQHKASFVAELGRRMRAHWDLPELTPQQKLRRAAGLPYREGEAPASAVVTSVTSTAPAQDSNQDAERIERIMRAAGLRPKQAK